MMHQDTPVPDPAAIDRYLAGDATTEESRAVEQWLDANPVERDVLTAVRRAVMDPFGDVPSYHLDARVAAGVDYGIRAARRMRRQADPVRRAVSFSVQPFGADHRQGGVGRQWKKSLVLGSALAMAASVVLSVVLRRGGSSSSDMVTTYATTNGQRATITLPDGSTATLNAASRLQVPTDFGHDTRTVTLSGEALFTVQRRRGVPFAVAAGGTIAKVLGTTFLVRRYDTDSTVTVAVRDGKVTVSSTVLTAQRQVEVFKTGEARVGWADPSQFSFASGLLTLDWVPLSEAIARLDRWYDADIRLVDPVLGARRIKMSFTPGSRTELAKMLEFLLDARVVQDGRVLTLYPR